MMKNKGDCCQDVVCAASEHRVIEAKAIGRCFTGLSPLGEFALAVCRRPGILLDIVNRLRPRSIAYRSVILLRWQVCYRLHKARLYHLR